MTWEIQEGDCLAVLGEMESESVQTCVTSPPYWGLRDYGTATWEGGDAGCDHVRADAQTKNLAASVHSTRGGARKVAETPPLLYADACGKCGAQRIDSQLGLEPTPEQYVENLVAVMREVRRVLRKDGTLWLNLGDSYSSPGGNAGTGAGRRSQTFNGERLATSLARKQQSKGVVPGLKPKDLVGIPWRVALALQADGWWLRSDIVWSKPNPMPESVTDRPTRAHEYIFLLTKSARYFYDADAIREPNQEVSIARNGRARITPHAPPGQTPQRRSEGGLHEMGRNRRSVWEITTQPYPEAHFATFPPKLVEPCILAGTSPKACGECGAPWERITERTPMVVRPGPTRDAAHDAGSGSGRRDTRGTMLEAPTSQTVGWEPPCDHDDDSGPSVVLDPFAGSGTTGVVALRYDRSFVGIELNPEYCELARNRIRDDAPLFNVEKETV